MLKKVSILLLIVMTLVLPLSSFAVDKNIVEIAVEDGRFTVLVAALQKANLVGALQGDGPFTVFAPTDAAFTKLLTALNITAEDLLNHPQLSEVLLYHVVPAKVMSTDLSQGQQAVTLQGENVAVNLTGGVFINQSQVIIPDLEATNGVIHVIDTVLVPQSFQLSPATPQAEKNIVEIAVEDGRFTVLVAALQKANLVGALQGDGPFTVFAPTDAAFTKLLTALNITAGDLLNHPQLSQVLLYHVVPAKVMSTDLSQGQQAATLQGENLTVNLMGGVFINQSQVIIPDLMATNGVIHVVDTVLVPQSFQLSPATPSPQTGTIGFAPYLVTALIAGSGLLIARKRK